ncbi:MAG: putative TonB-dependent receptor BfrD [Pseudomonas fluorescens]|nr:MAG: putative TonB-dependent receptor BfrD [Pseudomonas fluorescens]
MVLRFRPAVCSRLPLNLLGCLLFSAGSQAADIELPTVSVQGQDESGYRSTSAQVGGFSEAPLLDTPSSITVINESLIKDQQARLLSEVLRNDASVGDSYTPVGYYENFVVRGFSLNAASSYKINGRTLTGEQNVALENKQQVEVLKGWPACKAASANPAA